MNELTLKRIEEYLYTSEINSHSENPDIAITFLRLAVRTMLEELKELSANLQKD